MYTVIFIKFKRKIIIRIYISQFKGENLHLSNTVVVFRSSTAMKFKWHLFLRRKHQIKLKQNTSLFVCIKTYIAYRIYISKLIFLMKLHISNMHPSKNCASFLLAWWPYWKTWLPLKAEKLCIMVSCGSRLNDTYYKGYKHYINMKQQTCICICTITSESIFVDQFFNDVVH